MKVLGQKYLLMVLPATLIAFSSSAAHAEELVISGNGSGSASEVTVNSANTASITQSNDTGVNNGVFANSNTGGNNVNANNGEAVLVDTGNSQVGVTVVNDVNSSVVDSSDCCAQPTDVKVTGNGEGSINNVNTVNVNANTGNNAASNNFGNVTIQTGNIKVDGKILNTTVNVSKVNFSAGGLSLSALINGNGSGSANLITANFTTDTIVSVTNSSDIVNRLDIYAN